MQRRVDVLNNKPPKQKLTSAPSQKKEESKGESDKITPKDKWKVRLLAALFFAVVITSYILPDGVSKLITLGAIVLIAMHLYGMWVLVIEGKISSSGKMLILGYFLILVAAFLLPQPTYQLWQDIKETRDKMNRPGFFKETFSKATNGETDANDGHPHRVVSQQKVLSVRPGEPFKVAEIPSGTKVIRDETWKCDQGCILEIEHDDDLLCGDWNGLESGNGRMWHTGSYQGLRCMTTVVNPQTKRYREQFLLPAGPSNFQFPKNLVNVITSVGAIRGMGQVEATVSTTTMY